jgi:hypothetical protein
MATKQERQRAIVVENRRLRAALGAIHDLLHRNDVDGAHAAVECALDGETVSQPNITAGETAKLHGFIADFNARATRDGLMAATVVLIPSKTDERKVSIQLGGNVVACKVVEDALGGHSTYMGEHANA